MVKRRTFLLGTTVLLGVAGTLTVGWASMPQRQRLVGAVPLPVEPGQIALNGWVKVSPDGAVTIVMASIEMGQGAHTGAAMLLADEMDADWSRVGVEQAGYDAIYNNQSALVDSLPFFAADNHGVTRLATEHVVGKLLREIPGLGGTGGSSGIKNLWVPMRQAGAAARSMLVRAAAEAWGVRESECVVRDGVVSHGDTRKATFGELAAAAGRLPLPTEVALKPAAERRVIGKPVHRLDSAAKINGAAIYGVDVLPPGLLYASIRMCPTVGGSVLRYTPPPDAENRGVRRFVVIEPIAGGLGSSGTTSGGLAAIATSPFAAIQAVERASVEWTQGIAAGISTHAILSALMEGTRSAEVVTKRDIGDVVEGFRLATKIVEAEYQVPFLAHATMEPMNCTVQFKDGVATVWAASQMPGFAQKAVADALGIPADNVTLHIPAMGGGFGRRTFTDYIVQAARLAKETGGAPVQLLWTREEDMRHGYYRPAYAARYRAGLDAKGRVVAWHAVASGSSVGAPSVLDASADGASTKLYALPNFRVDQVRVEHPVPMGIWRSVNNSQNAFFFESFLDEVALASNEDPVKLRVSLLADEPRARRVLERAAEIADWGKTPEAVDGARVGRGVALHSCFGSHAAQVVDVAVSGDGGMRVTRVVCVVDCGTIVNPQLVKQQVEGAVIFGLSAAMHGEITFKEGAVQQSNFHDYAPLRMSECPPIITELIESGEKPGGVGELATPPVAPALANAIYAATRQRLRSLPLRPANTTT